MTATDCGSKKRSIEAASARCSRRAITPDRGVGGVDRELEHDHAVLVAAGDPVAGVAERLDHPGCRAAPRRRTARRRARGRPGRGARAAAGRCRGPGAGPRRGRRPRPRPASTTSKRPTAMISPPTGAPRTPPGRRWSTWVNRWTSRSDSVGIGAKKRKYFDSSETRRRTRPAARRRRAGSAGGARSARRAAGRRPPSAAGARTPRSPSVTRSASRDPIYRSAGRSPAQRGVVRRAACRRGTGGRRRGECAHGPASDEAPPPDDFEEHILDIDVGDEMQHLVPGVRLLGHLLPRPARRPRRPQAGAAPDPVHDGRHGPAPRPRPREVAPASSAR